MTPEAGLPANLFVPRVILLFTIVLSAACGQSEQPVSQDIQPETDVVPLVVKQWYPTPKHKSRLQGNLAPPVNQPFPLIPPQPVTQDYAPRSPWPAAVQQPQYAQPSPVIVFQGQQYVPAQTQQGWNPQQPAQSWQQPFAGFESQFGQRPWGNATAPVDKERSSVWSESWPPNTYYSPAGIPAAGGYQNQNGGQYWTVPPANYYGNVW